MPASDRSVRSVVSALSLSLCGLLLAATGFLVLARTTGIHPEITRSATIAGIGGTSLTMLGVLIWHRGFRLGRLLDLLSLLAMVAGAWILVLILASELSHYVVIPADIVGFGENGFLDFILKFREGLPLYTPSVDNNTVPYTPGAPIVTYLVASLVGNGTSIPLLRGLTIGAAALAGIVFSFGAANLAVLVYGQRFANRVVWVVTWAGLLIVVAFDQRFNLYTHTMHNDSAALLIAAIGFWIMTRHALTGRTWLLAAMVLLPSVGFLIKQSHLMWAGVFPLYLLLNRQTRTAVVVGTLSIAGFGITLGICWLLWGSDFFFWVFSALGAKEVSPVRTAFHLLEAGVPIAFFVFGGWGDTLFGGRSAARAVWLASVTVLMLGVWTSGAVWVHNHLGPGVMMATCWFFLGIVRAWPSPEIPANRLGIASGVQSILLSFSLVALFAGLGHLRNPRRGISPDLYRYIAETEAEFVGVDPQKILLDNGNWIYLRTGTLMRDRATPLAVHIGPNQSTMNLKMLDATKDRIRREVYDKILAHELDTPRTAYDFGKRGTGIPELIFEHYTESHRIAGVQGITTWWPTQMISEIIVYVRRNPL